MTDSSVRSTNELSGNLVVIQRNPVSGSGRHSRLLKDFIRELRQRDYHVRLFADRNRLDSFVRSEVPVGRLRCLVAAGGDGTMASLVHRHPQFPIVPLPMGTENLVARHLNIPASAIHVAQRIQYGRTRTFDTAEIDSTRFLVMASAGIDAAIVERLHAARSGNIRRATYVEPVLRTFVTWDFPEIVVRSLDDNTTIRGTHVVVANLPEYGFDVKLTPDADPSDGLLDVRVYQGRSTLRTTAHVIACRFGWESQAGVVRFRTRHVRVAPATETGSNTADGGIPVQADGDPAGQLPVDIRVNPDAMRLIIPAL